MLLLPCNEDHARACFAAADSRPDRRASSAHEIAVSSDRTLDVAECSMKPQRWRFWRRNGRRFQAWLAPATSDVVEADGDSENEKAIRLRSRYSLRTPRMQAPLPCTRSPLQLRVACKRSTRSHSRFLSESQHWLGDIM